MQHARGLADFDHVAVRVSKAGGNPAHVTDSSGRTETRRSISAALRAFSGVIGARADSAEPGNLCAMAGDAEDIRSRSARQPGRPERDAADAVPGREESGCQAAATYPVAAVTRRAAACARWGCS